MSIKQALIAELIGEALGECDPLIMNEIAWDIILQTVNEASNNKG